jgi:hypothetical protein
VSDATGYNPFLSSWDRDQENSACMGRELFRQAYSTPPDLYRSSSEQTKRAGPNMTDELAAPATVRIRRESERDGPSSSAASRDRGINGLSRLSAGCHCLILHEFPDTRNQTHTAVCRGSGKRSATAEDCLLRKRINPLWKRVWSRRKGWDSNPQSGVVPEGRSHSDGH